MQLKPWLLKIKKVGTVFISLVTLGLPIFVLGMQLRVIESDYSELLIWFPINPFTAVFEKVLPYLVTGGLFFHLYKNKKLVGELKTLGFVFTVLVFLISSQLLLSYFIISYR